MKNKYVEYLWSFDGHIHAICAASLSSLQSENLFVVVHLVHPMQLFKVLSDEFVNLGGHAEVVQEPIVLGGFHTVEHFAPRLLFPAAHLAVPQLNLKVRRENKIRVNNLLSNVVSKYL